MGRSPPLTKTRQSGELDLLLNNSQVRFILIRHGLNEDLDNLSVIHPINLEKIDQKPLSLFSMKSEYVKCYLNCESEAQKIMSDTKDLAGIYYWYNNVNGKAYVGSADNLPKRLSAYYYPSRLLNLDNLINRAILKYGHYNFSLIILETLAGPLRGPAGLTRARAPRGSPRGRRR